MSALTLSLSCCCGARLQVSVDVIHGTEVRRQREAFDTAHQVCRERERPLVMWGGDQA